MKLENIAIVVKADNGKVYQCPLNDSEQKFIKSILLGFGDGVIKIIDKPIDTIEIIKNEGKKRPTQEGE